MKTMGLLSCVLTSLVVGSCDVPKKDGEGKEETISVSSASTLRMLGGESHPMPSCSPSDEEIHYTVNILMPQNLNRLTKRSVNFRPKKAAKNDLKGDPNKGKLGENGELFHIFLGKKDALEFENGYVLVRVLLEDKNKSDLRFYRKEAINGVASGINGNVFCGNEYDPSGADYGNNIKEVSYFYINIDAFKNAAPKTKDSVPFNIWLNVEGFGDTPIIIDPKVRNEGEA